MADFVSVLRKTIEGLGENTPEVRARVYDKARATVAARLAALDPQPSSAVASRQRQTLEDAIREVESGYSAKAGLKKDDPFAELENVFASSTRRDPAPARREPAVSTPPKREPVFASPPKQPPAPVPRPDPAPWPESRPRADAAASRPQPAPRAEPELAEPVVEEEEALPAADPVTFDEPERRRSFAPLIVAVIVLIVLAGGGYAVWLNKADFMAMLGIGGQDVAATAPPAETAPVAAQPDEPAKPAPENAGTPAVQKLTQRLSSDGTETDPGPAGGEASVGEGSSVAAVTQLPAPMAEPPPAAAVGTDTASASDAVPVPPAAEQPTVAPPATADEAVPPASASTPMAGPETPGVGDAGREPATAQAPAADAPTSSPAEPAVTVPAAQAASPAVADGSQIAVGQKAIFYEERTNVAEGSAESGSVVWSLVQESPGSGQPTEPAIRAEATIPGKDIQLRMTIRRNADKTLPASHIIELIFLTPDNFDGGGIENILRFALKDTEEAAGSPLLGMPAKIADGFFLVALNDTKAETETNLGLLKREQWIDVPLVYKSGRRALFTMEKGIPGDKVFDEAIKAWQTASASAG